MALKGKTDKNSAMSVIEKSLAEAAEAEASEARKATITKTVSEYLKEEMADAETKDEKKDALKKGKKKFHGEKMEELAEEMTEEAMEDEDEDTDEEMSDEEKKDKKKKDEKVKKSMITDEIEEILKSVTAEFEETLEDEEDATPAKTKIEKSGEGEDGVVEVGDFLKEVNSNSKKVITLVKSLFREVAELRATVKKQDTKSRDMIKSMAEALVELGKSSTTEEGEDEAAPFKSKTAGGEGAEPKGKKMLDLTKSLTPAEQKAGYKRVSVSQTMIGKLVKSVEDGKIELKDVAMYETHGILSPAAQLVLGVE